MTTDASASAYVRLARSLPHCAGLVIVLAAAIVVGRPEAWIGGFAAIGPIVGALLGRAVFRTVGSNWRPATAFGLVIAVMTVGGYGLTRLSELNSSFLALFPVALLSFLFGAVNFVLVSVSRTVRAWRGQALDYPWIPDMLARALGFEPEKPTDGNR